ncbi:MAG: hypothetical protein K2K75_10120 [Muribaculaceae bacterium]|nr:hypothetical protein [Muribaculaceae bacterium]
MYDNKTVTLINCCDEKFEAIRKVCSSSSLKVGKADSVIEYNPAMMDNDFKQRNKDLLSIPRGAGLWIWKPYFILQTLESIPEGHYLIYLDAGVVVVNEFRHLISAMEASGQDIMVFELPLLAEEWTKGEIFSTIAKDIEDSVNQILAGYIVMKNTPFVRGLIQEWLRYMQDPVCILPHNVTDHPNHKNFVENRDDQSVFTLVCRIHGIKPFRDPSQFGRYPFKYAWYPGISQKFKRYSFRPHKYPNSPYPQILVSTRSENPKKKLRKERIIRFLDSLGIYRPLYMRLLKPYLDVVE